MQDLAAQIEESLLTASYMSLKHEPTVVAAYCDNGLWTVWPCSLYGYIKHYQHEENMLILATYVDGKDVVDTSKYRF